MRLKPGFLTVFTLGLFALTFFTKPTPVHAQGYGQTITCSSDNGKRNFCQANTRGGVQLTRQISGSACVQGQTWGWDNNRIWVDRGCRAEFTTGNNGGGWNGGGNNGQRITCSSDDGKRNFCQANTRGGVQLTRQISGSACVQGQTWGWNNNQIWVDRGCRAEFMTGTSSGGGWNGGGGGWNGGGNNGQTITCSSDDGKRNFCQANTRGGVQLTRQISGSACVQGQTWGWDNNRIWVDRGCRAEFRTNR